MNISKFIFVGCFFLTLSTISSTKVLGQSFAPDGRTTLRYSPIRLFLNKITVNLTTGYGRTYYRQDLTGFSLVNSDSTLYLLPGDTSQLAQDNTAFINWLNNPSAVNNASQLVQNGTLLTSSDSLKLGYRGSGYNIPITLTLLYKFMDDRFRVGAGFAFEWFRINKPLRPISPEAEILGNYYPDFNKTTFVRYFVQVGGKIYQIKKYILAANLQVGIARSGKVFNPDLVTNKVFFNFGLQFERVFSEYLRIILRPSIEQKGFQVTLPNGSIVPHARRAFYIQAGISFNYPEIPRCKIKSCKTQMKHVHGDREFRGQPLYIIQNPDYGELYPEYIKYKGKNKKKVMPY